MWILITDTEVETKTAAAAANANANAAAADAYSFLRKVEKRRKEIQKEILQFDSALGLDSEVFFRNRHVWKK
jgi:hypothetical protein